MESVFVKNSPTLGELSIIISPEDYQPVFEKELKKIANKAHIKGFRPGKTPVSVIRNMYGKSILADEINKLFSGAVNKYITENKIDFLGDLLPLQEEAMDFDLNTKHTYTFKLQIATASPFELNLNNISVKLYQPTINEEDLEAITKNLRERLAKSDEVENVLDEACTIVGKTTWQVESEDGGEPVLEECTCYLPIHSIFPEKQETLMGAKIGDTITIIPAQDLDLGEEDKKIGYIFGIFDSIKVEQFKNANVSIQINSISQKKPRELDKEFFKELFPEENIETIEQFHEKIITQEEANLAREFSYLNEALIKDALLESHQFDLPDDFLKNWLIRINEKMSKEAIEKEYHLFAKETRWSIIERKIVDASDIKVEQSEINDFAQDFILNQLRQYGLLNNPEFANFIPQMVKNYLTADKGKNLNEIYSKILRAKVIDSLKSNLQVENIKLNWKEVNNIANEYFKRTGETLNNSKASATEN